MSEYGSACRCLRIRRGAPVSGRVLGMLALSAPRACDDPCGDVSQKTEMKLKARARKVD
jgi:hypothetical protein